MCVGMHSAFVSLPCSVPFPAIGCNAEPMPDGAPPPSQQNVPLAIVIVPLAVAIGIKCESRPWGLIQLPASQTLGDSGFTTPRAPQELPWGPQDSPEAPQGSPKDAPGTPKDPSGTPRDRPRTPGDAQGPPEDLL